MKFAELIVLLPCHSLEDFPSHAEEPAAQELLAAWSGLWHPALIAAAERIPGWYRAETPPEALSERLIAVPEASESRLLAGWSARAETEGAIVLRGFRNRTELVQMALAKLGPDAPQMAPDLVADFLALGFCFLMVELLTRQMRYMSNVDESQLRNEAVAAANAAIAGDEVTARRHLHGCFELLTEAREKFYPVDSYLVDLTLLTPGATQAALTEQLASAVPSNVMLSGVAIEEMAAKQPELVAQLRAACERGTLSIVGGEYLEGEAPLEHPEAVLENVVRGRAAYTSALGAPPEVFGRRRYGLSPLFPTVLVGAGFRGALHFTLDDGVFPRASQSKTRWEGLDSTSVDAIAKLPVDARSAAAFLGLPRRVGESMDMDHVATVVFAHWPGQACEYYEDLRRMAAYGTALGKFVTLANYFRDTDRPSELTRFRSDQYRTPYLRQAVDAGEPDPVSRYSRHHRRRALETNIQTLDTLRTLLAPPGSSAPGMEGAQLPPDLSPALNGAEPQLAAKYEQSAIRLAQKLSSGSGPEGVFVFNPLSFSRRVLVDVSQLSSLPACEAPVLGVQSDGKRRLALVDVPAMGFVWLVAGNGKPRKGRSLADGNVLRNEHFEVTIHKATGGVRAIHDYASRSNHFSQQLALRLPPPERAAGARWSEADEQVEYSVMECEGIELVSRGPVLAEAVSRGRLVDKQGKELARFKQTYRLVRGERVLRLGIELEPRALPLPDPWNTYYASRMAWGEAVADIYRSVHLTAQRIDGKRIEALDYVEARGIKNRLAILCGGMPYHIRIGDTRLDTLLVAAGDRQHQFEFGIAVDHPQPLQAALDLLHPVAVVPQSTGLGPGCRSGWLFHLDARSVVATRWEPLVENERIVGFRVRLLETAGRGVQTRLRALRALGSAHQLTLGGDKVQDLAVSDDTLTIDLGACEWVQIEARWKG